MAEHPESERDPRPDAAADDPIVLPDLLFDDTETAQAAREALLDLAEQERRQPGGPTAEQLVSAVEQLSRDDY